MAVTALAQVQTTLTPQTPEKTIDPLQIYDFSTISPFSSPNSKGSDIEEYYDNLWKDQLNTAATLDDGIDPEVDNYFYCQFDESQQKL